MAMRIHLRPAGRRDSEARWLREEMARHQSRHTLTEDPDAADVLLLTDVSTAIGHAPSFRGLLGAMGRPELWRHWRRTYVFYEQDVPKPHLPGVYTELAWAPGIEARCTAVSHLHKIRILQNPCLSDEPPPDERRWLLAFMGRRSHPVRDRILAMDWRGRDDVLVEDTSSYHHFVGPQNRPGKPQRRYVRALRASRWALCPRGWSPTAFRIAEAMRSGVAPVVVSDEWFPPHGPDWPRFALWIPESDIPRLPDILEAQGDRWRAMGRRARAAWEEHLAPEAAMDHLSATALANRT